MKIIILGAGQGRRHAGGKISLAKNNDITPVDTNGDRLRGLQDKFDLRVVQGPRFASARAARSWRR